MNEGLYESTDFNIIFLVEKKKCFVNNSNRSLKYFLKNYKLNIFLFLKSTPTYVHCIFNYLFRVSILGVGG